MRAHLYYWKHDPDEFSYATTPHMLILVLWRLEALKLKPPQPPNGVPEGAVTVQVLFYVPHVSPHFSWVQLASTLPQSSFMTILSFSAQAGKPA